MLRDNLIKYLSFSSFPETPLEANATHQAGDNPLDAGSEPLQVFKPPAITGFEFK
jgi:hypothetical protein